MKKYVKTLSIAGALLSACSVHATILYSEGFDVAAGSDLTGLGFTNGGAAVVSDYTWATWSNYSIIADKSVDSPGNGTKYDADFGGPTIDSDASGSMFYTFTINGATAASTGWANFIFTTAAGPASTTNSGLDDVFTQWDGSNKGFDDGSDAVATAGNLATEPGVDYLVVGRVDFDAAAGGDTYSLSVFAPGEDPSAVLSGFQSQDTGTTTGIISNFQMRHNAGTIYGNVRVGTTLEDVGVVPEPSSFAIISGALALGFILMRRRIR